MSRTAPITRIAVVLTIGFCQLTAAADSPTTSPATQPAAGEDVNLTVTRIDPGPTRVTAALKDVSPADLFFKLAQAGEVGIGPQQEGIWNDPTLQGALFTAEWDKAPLWEAVAEACEVTGLKPSIETPNCAHPRIRLEKSPPTQAPFVIHGPALLRALSIVRSGSIGYAAPKPADDTVRISFQLLLEPRLRRFAWIEPIRFDTAKDDRGNAIPIPPADENAAQAYHQQQITAQLGYPENPGSRIAELRGSIRMHVVKELATIDFNDPFARPRELAANVGPHRLVLQPITGDPKQGWDIKLKLHRGPGQPDSHWRATAQPLGSFGAFIAAISPRGQRSMNGGGAGSADDSAHTDIHFAPTEPGDEPTALRVELPVSFQAIDMKFEFKDLPLP